MTPSREDILLALKQGRERIEEGWTQGAYCRRYETGPYAYCALGALSDPREEYSDEVQCIVSAATQALDQTCTKQHKVCTIIYNDTRGRTQSDILALYDATITRLQEAS